VLAHTSKVNLPRRAHGGGSLPHAGVQKLRYAAMDVVMGHLLETPHIHIHHRSELGLVRATRTDTEVRNAATVEKMVGAIEKALALLVRAHHAMLIDLRPAPIREETDFAKEMRAVRAELCRGFRRTAFLVQTRVGYLQVRRFLAEERLPFPVFDEEEAALAYLLAERT
jgi:hypothetical protein